MILSWFAAWETAWRLPVMGRHGQDFERAKLAVNHGMAPLVGGVK